MEKFCRIFMVLNLFITNTFSQNLVLNGNFDSVDEMICKKENMAFNRFYAKYWIIANQGTPNYYLVDSHNNVLLYDCKMNVKNHPFFNNRNLNFKIGDRFVGIYPFEIHSYLENITGHLTAPLIPQKKYKISLRILNHGTFKYSGIITQNYGYIFSKDSLVFSPSKPDTEGVFRVNLAQSPKKINLPKGTKKLLIDPDIEREKEPECFYHLLFKDNDVYADGVFDLHTIDTNWQTVESYYIARGDEKYITLSTFKFPNHVEVLKTIELFQSSSLKRSKIERLAKNNSNLILNACYPKSGKFTKENIQELYITRGYTTYYLIDDVRVEAVNE